jgi:hypothetical protein
MRTIAIGDIHGCLELLERLLGVMNYDPTGDRLVFVGDLIDRGPSPAGVVRFVRALQAKGFVVVIKGNHEDKCVQWFKREARAREKGKPNTMKLPRRLAEWSELSSEEVEWLAHLPIFEKVLPDWYAVHAGFEAVPMDKQKADRVIRVRWLNPTTGEHRGMDQDSDNPFEKPADCVYWMDRWSGPENVVFGHAVFSRRSPRVDRPLPGV